MYMTCVSMSTCKACMHIEVRGQLPLFLFLPLRHLGCQVCRANAFTYWAITLVPKTQFFLEQFWVTAKLSRKGLGCDLVVESLHPSRSPCVDDFTCWSYPRLELFILKIDDLHCSITVTRAQSSHESLFVVLYTLWIQQHIPHGCVMFFHSSVFFIWNWAS